MAQRQQPQTWTTEESGGGQVVMQSQPVYVQGRQRPVYQTQQGGYYYGVHPCCNTTYYNSLPQRQRCKRLAAFILGIFAAFFLV